MLPFWVLYEVLRMFNWQGKPCICLDGCLIDDILSIDVGCHKEGFWFESYECWDDVKSDGA